MRTQWCLLSLSLSLYIYIYVCVCVCVCVCIYIYIYYSSSVTCDLSANLRLGFVGCKEIRVFLNVSSSTLLFTMSPSHSVALSPRIRRPEREADYLPVCNTKVRNKN